MKNKYGVAAFTASILLLVLSSAMACSCPVVPFLAGVFAVIAIVLTGKMIRLASVLLALASFSAAYIDHQNEGKLRDRMREAVRRAEEKSQTQEPKPETK